MTMINATETVAFLDLAAMHTPLRDELTAAWNQVLTSSAFVGGEAVAEFEKQWTDYCGTAHCVGVANGTDSLELILTALGLGPGDEVIVPANTFVATAEAVVRVGATPVFVDVDPDTLLITPEYLWSAISARTRAVIVVHLYGQVAEMDLIMAAAEAAGIHVVEDAAQAHGATYNGIRAGAFGVAGSFSFYPGKNLGALGDAGAVVTNDPVLAGQVRSLANHGRGSHLLHTAVGRNSRLDGLQAAMLRIKLGHLDGWNRHRRAVHRVYMDAFAGTDVKTLATLDGGEPVHHLEVIRVPDRDRLIAGLTERGVETGIHYAHPCHKQPGFSRFDRHRLPVAETAADHQLSLPMHPALDLRQAEAVAELVLELL
ncbi:MAG: DegT/DnrJ/EryC1/StrS family aminotransferase [Acidimicrobiia bacterium]|nr:DegT/DnrJ/EryC1/StrS family aminotransferase [Acidimicrobiia bacterium]